MKNTANIIGYSIIGIMLVAFALHFTVLAEEKAPNLVQIHIDAIHAAQKSNKLLMPELHRIQAQVEANNSTALSSRTIICTSYTDYCKPEYLNPEESDVDLSSFDSF